MNQQCKRLPNDRAHLVTENTQLVHWICQRLKRRHPRRWQELGDEDARQVGFAALVRAAIYFDPSIGVKFVTYATHSVTRGVLRELARSSLVVDKSGASLSEGRRSPLAVPLVGSGASDRGEVGDDTEAGMTVADPRPCPAEEAAEADERAAVSRKLANALRCCTKRERDILRRRAAGETLQEVAVRHGITRERVRVIQLEAAEKVRRRNPRLHLAVRMGEV